MIVEQLWITRKCDPEDCPELIASWDGFCIDSNPEGWAEECKKALGSIGDDLDQYRYINVEIDVDAVIRTFKTPTVKAKSQGPHPADKLEDAIRPGTDLHERLDEALEGGGDDESN